MQDIDNQNLLEMSEKLKLAIEDNKSKDLSIQSGKIRIIDLSNKVDRLTYQLDQSYREIRKKSESHTGDVLGAGFIFWVFGIFVGVWLKSQ